MKWMFTSISACFGPYQALRPSASTFASRCTGMVGTTRVLTSCWLAVSSIDSLPPCHESHRNVDPQNYSHQDEGGAPSQVLPISRWRGGEVVDVVSERRDWLVQA